MAKNTNIQTTPYEESVISIMRRLPREEVSQLVSFAHFLELQTTQEYKKWVKEESYETGDERWEKLFAKPESKHVLRKMALEARQEYHAGETTDIETTEDGRLEPA